MEKGYLLVLILSLISCKSTEEIHWHKKGVIVEYDTISVKTYKDSVKADTTSYRKHTYFKTESPKLIRAKWYIMAVIIIVGGILLIKR